MNLLRWSHQTQIYHDLSQHTSIVHTSHSCLWVILFSPLAANGHSQSQINIEYDYHGEHTPPTSARAPPLPCLRRGGGVRTRKI